MGGVYVDPPIVGDKTERQRCAIRGPTWRFAPLEEPPPDLLGLRSTRHTSGCGRTPPVSRVAFRLKPDVRGPVDGRREEWDSEAVDAQLPGSGRDAAGYAHALEHAVDRDARRSASLRPGSTRLRSMSLWKSISDPRIGSAPSGHHRAASKVLARSPLMPIGMSTLSVRHGHLAPPRPAVGRQLDRSGCPRYCRTGRVAGPDRMSWA